jgi:putative membrane protein
MTTPAPQFPPEDPRVRLAGERTLLAWIRTGLAMMGFGFVLARFGIFLRYIALADDLKSGAALPPIENADYSVWIGTALVLLGIVVNMLAVAEHYQFLRRLNRGEPYKPATWSLGIVVAIALSILALFEVITTSYLFWLE